MVLNKEVVCTYCCKIGFTFSCYDETRQKEYSAVDEEGNAFDKKP